MMKRTVLKIILAASLTLALVSCGGITDILAKRRESADFYKKTAETAAVKSQPDDEKAGPPLSVDFTELKRINPDLGGWLFCGDTGINYPVAFGSDNSTYLHTLPDGSYSPSGTLFADCRTPADSGHIYIYGHCMKDGSMFGTLSRFSSQEYYEKHPVMYYADESGVYVLRIFSACYADPDDGIYDTGAGNREFFEYSRKRSCIETDVQYPEDGRIITLSTCAYINGCSRFTVNAAAERS